MIEENVIEAGAPPAEPSVDDSSYKSILAGEAEAPLKTDAGVKPEPETKPEVSQEPPVSEEVILEIGGKEYSIKQAELNEFLENRSKFADREKSLTEKEKSLNRDYTQKTQQVAEFRKSVQETFGSFPDKFELQNLGKIYKAYFSNPQARQTIDSILSGRVAPSTVNGQPAGTQEGNAYTSELEQKIYELEEKLGKFTTTFEERENSKVEGEARQITASWKAEKVKAGAKIEDDFIASEMEPHYAAIRAKYPDWTPNQILDRAYKLATIDDIEKSVQGQVLKSADQAKSTQIPRIKPKSAVKSDSDLTYKDILLGKS